MDQKKVLGPAVKKLIANKMAMDAIPKGGSVVDGIEFLKDRDRIVKGFRDANDFIQKMIVLVRSAKNPNPFKDADDETIAGELLRRINEKKGMK